MAFEWKAFILLAQQLEKLAHESDEAEAALRSAVSRAYYGAFGHANNYARDWLGFEPRQEPEDHGRLRAFLKGKRRRNVADRLDRLRQWRNECDYRDEIEGDLPAMATSALAEAASVIKELPPPASKP